MKWIKPVVMFYVGASTYTLIEVLYRHGATPTSPVMSIVGGLLILMLDQINNRISWNVDLIAQGIIGSCMATGFELIIGEFWRLMGWMPIWDYSSRWANYHGVICPLFSFIWIFVSILGIFIADALNYYLFEEKPTPYYIVAGRWVIRFREKHCKLN